MDDVAVVVSMPSMSNGKKTKTVLYNKYCREGTMWLYDATKIIGVLI